LTPKISVIIPVYKVEKYLQACIDSLMAQTMEDIEYLFIDNGSPDNCPKILEENRKKHGEKMRVIHLKENCGYGGAWNIGIREASAPLIGFTDSDDFVSSKMYERLYDGMCRSDADVVYVQCAEVPEDADEQAVLADETIKPLYRWTRFHKWNGVELTDEGRMDILRYPTGNLWSGLWKKEIFTKNDIVFPEIAFADDYGHRLAKCYFKKVSFVYEVHYFWRARAQSDTRVRNEPGVLLARAKISRMLMKALEERDLLNRHYEGIEWFILTFTGKTIYQMITRLDTPPQDEIKRMQEELHTWFPKFWENRYLAETKNDHLRFLAYLLRNQVF